VSAGGEPLGTLDAALENAARLLTTRPLLAQEQAEEILKQIPGQPVARLVLALARRALDTPQSALALLRALVADHPAYAAALIELGLMLRDIGQDAEALEALQRGVALDSGSAAAWMALADLLGRTGDEEAAQVAFSHYIRCSTRQPQLQRAAAALIDNRLAEAESLLRARVRANPNDVTALRMLAEIAARLRRYADAEVLLRHCIRLAPSFVPARQNLALVLHRQNKSTDALAEIGRCLEAEPGHIGHLNVKAAVLSALGEGEAAVQLYRQVLHRCPNQAKIWMSYGHVLKTVGLEQESIAAYSRSIELAPLLGESHWSLANLKTYRFARAEVEAMRVALAAKDLGAHERFHFHFALGKALEDAGDFADSFAHYAEGNRLRRLEIHYDGEALAARMERSRALFSAEFIRSRAKVGCPAPDPIFIVGLPRSGSTLLEQILSSHSQVEGTMELPEILAMARRLAHDSGEGEDLSASGASYPDVLATLTPEEWRRLGEEYLERTRIYRKSARPFFIDKMPNNFWHLGLIMLALPSAKIIDARRHPLACCFSGFKQHFALGQHYTYRLEDLGRYYRDYAEFMAHFDRVAPGRIHRVIYERLVDDLELEVRRLLEYCELPFEAGCLEFYRNDRAVRTASSEQVRRPLFRDSIDQWRHFEPWLGPLKEALGSWLQNYPPDQNFCSNFNPTVRGR
jgi:tetratricopeptide (TPR) repeat protein